MFFTFNASAAQRQNQNHINNQQSEGMGAEPGTKI